MATNLHKYRQQGFASYLQVPTSRLPHSDVLIRFCRSLRKDKKTKFHSHAGASSCTVAPFLQGPPKKLYVPLQSEIPYTPTSAPKRATQMVATPQRDGCSKNVDLKGFKANYDRFCQQTCWVNGVWVLQCTIM